MDREAMVASGCLSSGLTRELSLRFGGLATAFVLFLFFQEGIP